MDTSEKTLLRHSMSLDDVRRLARYEREHDPRDYGQGAIARFGEEFRKSDRAIRQMLQSLRKLRLNDADARLAYFDDLDGPSRAFVLDRPTVVDELIPSASPIPIDRDLAVGPVLEASLVGEEAVELLREIVRELGAQSDVLAKLLLLAERADSRAPGRNTAADTFGELFERASAKQP